MGTDYSKYELSIKEKYSFLTAGYASIFAVVYLFYHSILFSFAAGLLSLFLLSPFEKWKVEKRKALLITQFKDMLYSMSASIAANRQMTDAIGGSLESLRLLYDEDTPLVQELDYMVKSIEEHKESEIRLLQDFSDRSGCEDIENFVQVYSTCVITGGDMEIVMKNTIDILMDKISIEREIRTLTAQKKFEGNVISAMPLIVILFLNISSPDYLAPLYATFYGRIIMTAALAGLMASHWMTRKITDIEV